MEGTATMKDVYTITEREAGKASWTKIGVAFVNRDQSLNVVLEGLPVNGKLHIRDMRANRAEKGGAR